MSLSSRLISVSLLSVLVLVLLFVPLPIPPYLDFQVLYHANMGLLRGIPLYDHEGQVQMIARLAGVPPENVFVLPFPYPPWYALITLPLALLPIRAAARLWFGINLLLLFLSTWLLAPDWPRGKRLILFLLAVFFVPALGTLYVGQYTFPILFGACLWIHALRKEKSWPAALASALLTFKPHLGVLILLLGVISLWRRGDAFGRRTLKRIALAGSMLFALGFIADRAWPVNYVRSLLAFRGLGGVFSCELCASLPVRLLSLLHGQANLTAASLLGLLILLLSLGWGARHRLGWMHPARLTALSILVTLLASPYLLNYDFVLLLVPFIALIEAARPTPSHWLLLLLAYLLPMASIGLWGRQGNLSFSLSALVLLAVLGQVKAGGNGISPYG